VSVEYEVFPRLVGGGLHGLAEKGRWIDIGTPPSYLAANLEQMPPGGLIDPTAEIGEGAGVTDSVVGPGAVVGSGATVRRSVLLAGALVKERQVVENAIVDENGPVW
jgi:mannose-1-phosphate guanylyltransferase